MEDPTHPGHVTAAIDSSFEELRKLFPAVERAAVAAIESTVEHVRSGSCVPGAEAFLQSLGIEVPTTSTPYQLEVEVPVTVNVTRTVEISVLEEASSDSDRAADVASESLTRTDLSDAISAGGATISPYADWQVESAYPAY